jgi:formylglycine-generating enzyme required for sulfatase activity
MTDKKRLLKVFICHASQDKPKAFELYRYLKQRKIDAWIDEVNLLPGQDWDLEIYKATRDADAIIICLSKESIAKEGYVQKEVRRALDISEEKPDGTIFVIPVRLEECEVPIRLKKYQWVDLFDEGGYPKLMKSLKERASQLERATVQVSKQDENSSYLAEKPKQESHDGISVHVNGNVQGNLIIGNENVVQSQTAYPEPKKPVIAKSPVGIENKEQRIIDFNQYGKTITPHEHFIKLERRDSDAIAYQDYIEQNPELRNLIRNMGNTLKHATFKQGLLLTSRAVSPMPEKPIETKPSIAKSKKELEKRPRKLKTGYIIAIIGAAATIIAVLMGILPQIIKPVSVPTATMVVAQAPTSAFTLLPPSATPKPSLTPTKSYTHTPTPLPTEITDAKGVSMVFVPVGKFIMGSSNPNTFYLDRDENPAHNVFLDAFYIDKYEVTNSLYKICVDAGVCTGPYNRRSNNSPQYYGNSEFDNYPVIYVDWYQAKAYCEWRGTRLPTEAEWEKTARGTDERYYPWESNFTANKTEANFTDISVYTGDTTEVGSYPLGKSVYGAYDMAGNILEWVNDWYKSDYYTTLGDNSVNPQGPSEGESKVLRGGSWWPGGYFKGIYREGDISTFNRFKDYPSRFHNDIGFRCARSAP